MKSSAPLTSFRKKGAELINIPGTRVSVQNAQLLTSTGSSTLDFFIGGGLAIGTICLLEEDCYNCYSNLLLKYFLSEGVVKKHLIFLASGEKTPEILLKELPAVKTVEASSNLRTIEDDQTNNLKIAWRYKNISTENNVKVESHNTGYDLSKTMPEEMLHQCSFTLWDPSDHNSATEKSSGFLNMPYSDLYEKIKREIDSKGLKTATKAENILRIGINSLGSPLWQCSNEQSQKQSLVRFLYVLKALLRTSFAVAVVTVPSFLLQDIVLTSRLEQICDTVVRLESFVGSHQKSNPLFKDFDGLLHIKKLPVLNTFMYQHLTPDLAFKLKRKGLLIERLHLPPDFEETSEEQQALGCSGLGKKLDF